MSVLEMETQRVAVMWELIFDYYITFWVGGCTAVAVRVMQHPQLEQLKQLTFPLNNV
jgi:hypothetical protein